MGLNKPFAWSHSALGLYEQCPYKYYRIKFLDKNHPEFIKDVFGKAAKDGIKDHDSLEAHIKNNKPLPKHLEKHKDLCDMIKAQTVDAVMAAEAEFALNQQLQPCDWFSRAGQEPTWLRGKLDISIIKDDTCLILDWKTGKVKEDMDQLKIFALLAFAHYPQVQTVKAAYIWLKTREMTPDPVAVFKREEVAALWREQFARLTPLINSINTNQWPGNPGYLCQNYCIVSEKGQCPHFTRK